MRPTHYLLLLFCLSSLTAFGQTAGSGKDFRKFLSYFEKAKLPLCEDYSGYGELYDSSEVYASDTITGDTEIAEENDTIIDYVVESAGIALKDSAGTLPAAYYSRFLEKAIDSVFTAGYRDTGLYYFVFPLRMIKAGSFTAITVEFQYYLSLGGSFKYLVTLDKAGRVLGLLEIASYEFAGTGIDDYGGRVPRFPLKTGCIDEKWELTVNDESNGSKERYKVTPAGKIIALEAEE